MKKYSMAETKHSIYSGSLNLKPFSHRIVIIFRRVIYCNVLMAKIHYKNCQNVESLRCKCSMKQVKKM